MSLILPYDTETTGLHYGFKSKSLTDPSHPHLVQVSALIVDTETKRVNQSINLVVRPDGWEIPEEAANVHGITTEYAEAWGSAEKSVLDIFLELWLGGLTQPLERIAHNAAFDKNVITTTIARHYGQCELLDAWTSGRDFCTMQAAKPIVNAQTKPHATTGKTRIKFPNLIETYEYFFGEKFDKAHTANADVVATMNIYFALMEETNG